MDERTLEALKASIAKWERNAQVDYLSDAKVNGSDCPLCGLFVDDDCIGCPVHESTRNSCHGTPYDEAWLQKSLRHNLEAFRKAALAEVEFLKSLLPEGERDGPSP